MGKGLLQVDQIPNYLVDPSSRRGYAIQKVASHTRTSEIIFLISEPARRTIDFIGWGNTLEVTLSNHLDFLLVCSLVVLYNISLKGKLWLLKRS